MKKNHINTNDIGLSKFTAVPKITVPKTIKASKTQIVLNGTLVRNIIYNLCIYKAKGSLEREGEREKVAKNTKTKYTIDANTEVEFQLCTVHQKNTTSFTKVKIEI